MTGAAAVESPTVHRALQARAAVWLVGPGLVAFIALLLVERLVVGNPYDLSLRVLTVLLVLNILAALTADRWATYSLSVYVYETFYVVVITIMLYCEWDSSWELDRAMLLNSYFTLAIGCTGGRHRSVALVDRLAQTRARAGVRVQVQHRDVRR